MSNGETSVVNFAPRLALPVEKLRSLGAAGNCRCRRSGGSRAGTGRADRLPAPSQA